MLALNVRRSESTPPAGLRLHAPPCGRPAAHRRNVVAVSPASPVDFLEVAGSLARRTGSRVVMLYAREISATVPLGGVGLDPGEAAALHAFRGILASMGFEVEVAVVDSRHAGETTLEYARAMRSRAVAVGGVLRGRGGLDSRAAHMLRRLQDLQLLLFSG